MSEPASLLVPQFVLDDWAAALQQRDPRALELAYALALALPQTEMPELTVLARTASEEAAHAINGDVRARLQEAYKKYDALRDGSLYARDMGNWNVLGFERTSAAAQARITDLERLLSVDNERLLIADNERLLIVNNLARVTQPCKFREYAGRRGWDILNRVEFTFPPRAQLEPYEFLWLMIE